MGRPLAQLPLLLILCQLLAVFVDSQTPIPSKYDGFTYNSRPGGGPGLTDNILIAAFYDPVCPDSRDSWPPLKQAFEYYSGRVSVLVHPFPLPYHDHAFIACRALHIANNLNTSTTFPLLEKFFKTQEKFYNKPTYNMSKNAVVETIVKMMAEVTGTSYISKITDGFHDSKTDMKTRVSFKYGCSRGVSGTPFFFVNGFLVQGAGSPVDYKTWRSIIDSLLNEKTESSHKS